MGTTGMEVCALTTSTVTPRLSTTSQLSGESRFAGSTASSNTASTKCRWQFSSRATCRKTAASTPL